MTLTPEPSVRLSDLRQAARERFDSLPWPTRTDEEWRRTDPASLPLKELGLQAADSALNVGWEPLPPAWAQAGVIVTDLASAQKKHPELLEQYLFQSGRTEGLAKFVALHQALSQQGLFCYVPEGVRLDSPLNLWMEPRGDGATLFPHLLLVLGRGASAVVIDERRGPAGGRGPSGGNGGSPLFSDEMAEIFLGPEAELQYIHLQRWGRQVTEVYTQRALLEGESQLVSVTIGLGGKLTKANVETVLQGPAARSELLGVLSGSDDQHYDFHTLQDHRAKATWSDLLYKSALSGEAKAIYTGLIRIAKQAQKSDAYQANRSLLLSQGASADSIPMLEIEADDVRCTHGVAVGPVDEEQLFYLMSRGLEAAQAERLIVEGFFEPVFRRLPSENLRQGLMAEVMRQLTGGGDDHIDG